MGASTTPSTHLYFGSFELDPRSGELWKNGRPVKLPPQPTKLLIFLASRPGELVTREEIKQNLWGVDTFVDFEQGLNFSVKKIRAAIGDNPDHPEFIQTLPRRGYRFTAPVSDHAGAREIEMKATAPPAALPQSQKLQPRHVLTLLATATIAGILVFAANWGHLRERWWGGASAHRIESLAVLPLHNLSQDPEQEYFSDGMTDELITDLAKFGRLRVISHTSVERYKETKRPLPEIAGELGVDAIVEGTVMRSGDRVRITAQLIDARSDRHLWAESYERDLRDVLALQDEVARRIAAEIGTSLAGDQARLTNTRVVDPAAHEAYLRGNFYWNRLNCDGFNKALDNFQQAVTLDPSFAQAYVGLAQSYFTLTDWGCGPQAAEVIPKSKAALLKAIELEPNIAAGHAWLGKLIFFYEWDWPKAEREFKQAKDLDSNYVATHLAYAVFLVAMGRQDQGFAEMRMAHQLDPTSELTNVINIYVLYLTHQYDQAIEQARKTIELYPGSGSAYYWLAATYERRSMYQQAVDAYLESKALGGAKTEQLTPFRSAYQKSGMGGYWQQELEIAKRNKPVDARQMAVVYGHMGEKKRTLEFLNQCFQDHCDGLNFLKVDPLYDGLREDPRFKELLTRLRL